jgi:hypothetical protein
VLLSTTNGAVNANGCALIDVAGRSGAIVRGLEWTQRFMSGRERTLRPPTLEVLMRVALCLTLVVVVVVAVLASAPAVSAAPPLRSTVVLDETFVYPVGDPNPCPFEVTYRNQGTFFVTTFVDANGNTIRELDRGAYFLESYSANGKVISSKSPAMVHFDPATNTLVGTGNQRHFILPGIGILYAQAGRFVIDLNTGETISVSGLDVPLSERLCAALAP